MSGTGVGVDVEVARRFTRLRLHLGREIDRLPALGARGGVEREDGAVAEARVELAAEERQARIA